MDQGSSPLPIRRLSDVGGDFVGWSQDGTGIYFSLGGSFFSCAINDASQCGSAPTARPKENEVELVVPRDEPRGRLLLRGARLVTMRGDEILEDGDLLIQNNRIRAVGRRG